jgi:hypothetical protein
MAKKKKYKADNLTGLWKRLDEVVPLFLAAKVRERKAIRDELSALLVEANASTIPGAIAQSVVHPYLAEEGAFTVEFLPSDRDGFGRLVVWVDRDEKRVGIDPVGLYMLREELLAAAGQLAATDAEDALFDRYRSLCLFREVAKLPQQYLIFIAVLREIAQAARIVSVEKRDGGYADSDSPVYLAMLWAFKEFEQFYQRNQHRDLRADYGIIWHEGQWVEALGGR